MEQFLLLLKYIYKDETYDLIYCILLFYSLPFFSRWILYSDKLTVH